MRTLVQATIERHQPTAFVVCPNPKGMNPQGAARHRNQ